MGIPNEGDTSTSRRSLGQRVAGKCHAQCPVLRRQGADAMCLAVDRDGRGAPIQLTTHRVRRDQSDEDLEMMHKMADNAGKLLIVFCVF